MTPQEAIEHINKIAFVVENEIEEIKTSKLQTALKTAIKALEKQIPKKILDKSLEFDGYYGLCPCCNKVVDESKDFSRCWYCGQALDWSDTK